MTLQAAFEALRDDSERWSGASAVLSSSATTAASLTLDVSHLSWMAPLTGLSSSYEATRAHVEDILRAGAEETGRIADTLLDVWGILQDADSAAAADLAGTWDPVV